MLNPTFNIGNTPHVLRAVGSMRNPNNVLYPDEVNCDDPYISAKSVAMFNIAPEIPSDKVIFGTTRVVRIYQQSADGPSLMRRIDWQLPIQKEDAEKLAKRAATALRPYRRKFTHIVIRDLHSRVLSPKLIEAIKRKSANDAQWYIATRTWMPEWFKNLETVKDNVALLLIPELAALKASRDGHFSWIRQGYASMMGMQTMDRLAGAPLGRQQKGLPQPPANPIKTFFPSAHIVVVPEDLTVLAREAGGQQGFLRLSEGRKNDRLVPRASIFFPALTARLLLREEILAHDEQSARLPGERRFESDLRWAVEYTNEWIKEERDRLSNTSWEYHKKMPMVDLSKGLADEDWKTFALKREYPDPLHAPARQPDRWHFNWTLAKKRWTDALLDGSNGVIQNKGSGQQLQLFRAMTHVEDFVCVHAEKRADLHRLVEHARGLTEQGARKRHRSVAIIDHPGNGKTHLMTKLAQTVGMRLLTFNITQLRSEDDLLHCFDSIVNSQAENAGDVHLVFFDEINALLQGQPVFRSFLTVLDEGYYVRAGNQFQIAPCFWVFAGTGHPEDPSSKSAQRKGHTTAAKTALAEAKQRYTETKWGDFRSRLTLDLLEFSKYERSELEASYVGVNLIRTEFPDVNKITRGALKGLGLVGTSEKGLRRLRQFVRSLHDVQESIVTAHNFDEDLWKEYCKSKSLRVLKKDNEVVDIEWKSSRGRNS